MAVINSTTASELIVRNLRVTAEGGGGYRLDWSLLPWLSVARVSVESPIAAASISLQVTEAKVRFVSEVVHPIFIVTTTQGGSYRLAERRIALEGCPNFRDFGGYINRQGRQVRWGCLYRSGRLSALTPADLRHFESLGIGLVCDFRQLAEVEASPSVLPEGELECADLSIDPGNLMGFFARVMDGAVDEVGVGEFMCGINDELVLEHSSRYRQMFECLLSTARRPALVHCTAGKDRTGFAAKLLLSALGVERETIMHDYLLTNDYLPIDQEIASVLAHYGEHIDPALLRPMLEVRTSYLQSAFAAIDKHFGSVSCYLTERIGLTQSDLNELQARYLYAEG
ncbi:protein-tyrosine phosphatase [Sinobacterium caligoides]|uniref:Protein-tyrosine phosphatase n=1 Tax=Sinobacterium caligoides TaxID=933926 RepID=A0A3N2D516_9GAMM|nr:tyrosine-protein phosphatase [Sinobacterium caligoides]ROR94859.1 protein-tyrosine phosphatase [Sinobacterium caligoides]